MRTRSRVRSRLRARGWPDELSGHGAASNQGRDRSTSDSLAFVRAEWVAIEQVFPAYDSVVRQVHQPQVRVKSRSDVALARQPEPRGDVGRSDRGDALQLQVSVRQQQAPRRLAA